MIGNEANEKIPPSSDEEELEMSIEKSFTIDDEEVEADVEVEVVNSDDHNPFEEQAYSYAEPLNEDTTPGERPPEPPMGSPFAKLENEVEQGRPVDSPSKSILGVARKGYAGIASNNYNENEDRSSIDIYPSNPPTMDDTKMSVIGLTPAKKKSSPSKPKRSNYNNVTDNDYDNFYPGNLERRIEVLDEDENPDSYFDPYDASLDPDANFDSSYESSGSASKLLYTVMDRSKQVLLYFYTKIPSVAQLRFSANRGIEQLRESNPSVMHARNIKAATMTSIVIVFCLGVVVFGLGIHEERVIHKGKENIKAPIPDCSYKTLQDVLINEMNFDPLDMPSEASSIHAQQLAYIWLSNVDSRSPLEYCDFYDVIQKFVLAVLYYSMDGDQWPLQMDFMNEKANLCSWNTVENGTQLGLLCEGEKHETVVTSIRLLNNELKGTLPKELGKLTLLEEINFDNNEIEGTIPSEIANLPYLNTLMLSKNFIGGIIPKGIMNMTQLQYLGLRNNMLTGPIPTEIGIMNSLLDLRIDGNLLDSTMPTEIGQLSNVITASFFYNSLTGTIPTEVGMLSSIRNFEVNFNSFTGTIPSEIGSMKQLHDLDLYENQLEGAIPTELGKLENLINLELHNNALTGTLPTELGKLSSLQKLELYKNSLQGSIPKTYLMMRNLNYVDITWENNITNLDTLCNIEDLTIWIYCGQEIYSANSCNCCECWQL